MQCRHHEVVVLQNEVDEEVGQYEYDEYVDTQVSIWYNLLYYSIFKQEDLKINESHRGEEIVVTQWTEGSNVSRRSSCVSRCSNATNMSRRSSLYLDETDGKYGTWKLQ